MNDTFPRLPLDLRWGWLGGGPGQLRPHKLGRVPELLLPNTSALSSFNRSHRRRPPPHLRWLVIIADVQLMQLTPMLPSPPELVYRWPRRTRQRSERAGLSKRV